MAWRDDYRPGSFRGVAFYLKNSTRTGGRRVILDEYPLRDTPSTQDMGRKARQFNLEMTLIGPDYMVERDRLIEALESYGPGTLIHPFYGEQYVVVMGDYSIQESTEQGGLARISQNFAEAGETPRPESEPVPGAEVNAAADQVQEEAVSEFEDEWDVSGFTSSVAESAIENLQSATSAIANAGGLLSGAGQLSNLVNELSNSFQELILAPGKLAAGLLATVRGLTSTVNPFAALRAQMSLFDFGRDDKPVRVPSYTTPAREQQAINQAAISTLIERIAVAEAARIATGRPLDKAGQILPGPIYDNRDEAVGIRDEIVIELDRQQLQASPERYPALVMLTARLVKDMNRRSTDLTPLTQYQPLITQPALLIAHRLYGDARRADEIVSRNRIAHPGFVQGGQILEVLKHA